jgi:hypothetical protein
MFLGGCEPIEALADDAETYLVEADPFAEARSRLVRRGGSPAKR